MLNNLHIEQSIIKNLSDHLSLPIFSNPPQHAKPPYITVSDISSAPWLLKPKTMQMELLIKVFSIANGNSEILHLMSKIKHQLSILHNYNIIDIKLDWESCGLSADGQWLGEIEVKIYILHEAQHDVQIQR